MIYATLRPIRQWHHRLVPPNLLLLALFTGAVWLAAARGVGRRRRSAAGRVDRRGVRAGGGVVKLAYWRQIDAAPPVATIESATGLGSLGQVRMLESPHTEENYLLREMGYAIARKHASRLRTIALAVGFIAPVVLLLVGGVLAGPAGPVLLVVGRSGRRAGRLCRAMAVLRRGDPHSHAVLRPAGRAGEAFFFLGGGGGGGGERKKKKKKKKKKGG